MKAKSICAVSALVLACSEPSEPSVAVAITGEFELVSVGGRTLPQTLNVILGDSIIATSLLVRLVGDDGLPAHYEATERDSTIRTNHAIQIATVGYGGLYRLHDSGVVGPDSIEMTQFDTDPGRIDSRDEFTQSHRNGIMLFRRKK